MTFKDEEIAKSKVGKLKTEVLIEKDGIGESWGSLIGKRSRRALGIGSGSTRNDIRFLIFPDILGEHYPMLMHMHHFLTVICRLKYKTNKSVSC